ncbi:MAG: chemotaxis protein [Hyphomicrobiales bacterium]|nr:chemotaxis protein [Hyphomicrobiales bacterium]
MSTNSGDAGSGRFRALGSRAALGAAATLTIVATLGAMLHLAVSAQREIARADREVRMRAAGQALTSAIDQAGRFALAQAETVARRPAVQKALAANDRAALMELSQGPWTYLKEQAGVTIYGFHSADLRYLLRVHKPESHGDDISSLRPMALAANKTGRSQVGVEIGVSGLVGVRGIAPVRLADQRIGTMEVGLDLQPILDQVKALTNAELAVVLSRSLAGLSGGDATTGDLLVTSTTNLSRFSAAIRGGRAPIARETEIAPLDDGGDGTLLRLPLVDFSGRLVGNLALIASFPEQASQEQRLRTDLTVAAVVGGIVAFVVFSVIAFGVLRRREEDA